MAENLDIVLVGLSSALSRQDAGQIAGLLAPGVVWEGPQPGLRCDGRDQAMQIIQRAFGGTRWTADAIEAFSAGDDVVVGLHGPGLNGIPGDRETVGQVYYVLTLRDGKVVRWRTFATRAEALARTTASAPAWQ
ncbi:MAG TPA: nuclear transport factor 2 family protein [Streptosporangiaceae bacterium]|nr:nuclear transport factor 2 family protein [Streptosporangiaceae bacterium]